MIKNIYDGDKQSLYGSFDSKDRDKKVKELETKFDSVAVDIDGDIVFYRDED